MTPVLVFRILFPMSDSPYETPSAEVIVPSGHMAASNSPYGEYRDIRGVAKMLMLFLLAMGILELTFVGAAFFSISELQNPSSDERLDQLDSINQGIGVLYGVFSIVTIVIWCTWTHRSCKNAWFFNSLGRSPLISEGYTPGWAVGYYFIPIVMLWKPFQAMIFIRDSVTRLSSPIGMITGWWWTFWILTIFSERIASKTYIGDTYDDYIGAQNLTICLSPLAVASVITAMLLVRRISKAQTESAVAGGASSGFQHPTAAEI